MTETAARELTSELIQISREILIQSTNPKLPQLGQLILRRGKLLEELGRLSMDAIPQAGRNELQDTLLKCRQMDETIEVNLSSHRGELAGQLKNLKEGYALLDKYRTIAKENQGSITEEA